MAIPEVKRVATDRPPVAQGFKRPKPRRDLALMHRIHAKVADSVLVDWFHSPLVQKVHRSIPSLPEFVSRRLGTAPHMGPKSLEIPELPDALKTAPGIPRDHALEEEAQKTLGPLPVFMQLHHEAYTFVERWHWRLNLFMAPRFGRAYGGIPNAPIRKEGAKPSGLPPIELTQLVKEKAAELGMSAVGITKTDPMVRFHSPQDWEKEKRNWTLTTQAAKDLGEEVTKAEQTVLVCLLEQNWEATQAIPSLRAERAHYDATTRVLELASQLAAFIRDLGYSAHVEPKHSANIAYAVEAGLGQLGLNGQLLTPFAGPRVRMNIIISDAPLVYDKPVDYGVPAICDACKACVVNCPPSAIRSTREMSRGVYKAKIKTERCLPIVAQVAGCAVCQKVCPAQRYGLPAVINEFKATGKILGRGTDELEGYVWPVDGKYYGPGERPDVKDLLNPPGWKFDPTRRVLPMYEEHKSAGPVSLAED